MATQQVMVTAVSGGIGSGKSVVCRILQTLGYEVYDCDSRAKAIMDGSSAIMDSLEREISPEVIETLPGCGRRINRKRLADIAFSDYKALAKLNAIVHSAVKSDIVRWESDLKQLCSRRPLHLFVETAILLESGLDKMVDNVWEVYAPLGLRVERAMHRDNAPRHLIEARVRNQHALSDSDDIAALNVPVSRIINDDLRPLLPQILLLLDDERVSEL